MSKLSLDQAIIVTGFTGVLACPFSNFHADVERRLGRSVWTHEFASKELKEKLKEEYRSDFVSMCAESEKTGKTK